MEHNETDIEYYPIAVEATVLGKLIINLGFREVDPEIERRLRDIYKRYSESGQLEFDDAFVEAVAGHFKGIDENSVPDMSDRLLTNITSVIHTWLFAAQHFYKSQVLMAKVLAFAFEIDEIVQTRALHKGTPYYFLGESALAAGDVETGLLAMSASVQEDKKNYPDVPDTPGQLFFGLEYEREEQHFKGYVEDIAGFIKQRLGVYRYETGNALDEVQLWRQFIQNDDLHDLSAYFLFSVVSLMKLLHMRTRYTDEIQMAPLVYADSVFRLTSLIDFYSYQKIMAEDGNPIRKFAYRCGLLSKKAGFYSDESPKSYIKSLGVTERIEDFDSWIDELLDGKYIIDMSTEKRAVTGMEADVVLTYGLRNFTAHKVQSEQILWQNRKKVSQAIFNVLFLMVELYG